MPATLCALLFLAPLGAGLAELPAAWAAGARSSAALSEPVLTRLPDSPEKDYRFLREVASRLRRGDRLVLFQDGKLRDIAIPILSGGWFGDTELVFDPDEAATRAELEAQAVPKDQIEQALRFLATLRRPAAEVERMVERASVAVALRSLWAPAAGTLLLEAGPSHRAWRLR